MTEHDCDVLRAEAEKGALLLGGPGVPVRPGQLLWLLDAAERARAAEAEEGRYAELLEAYEEKATELSELREEIRGLMKELDERG